MVLCAVTVTGLVVRREVFSPPPAAAAAEVESRTVPDWRSYTEGQRIGPADASVTIVEFSDFECPFCRVTADRLRAIRARYPRDVALVYRHYPLSYHKNAVPAAKASICAARQGRFEGYHDALFAQQDSLGLIPWTRLARIAGVPNEAEFEACMQSSAPDAEIERDLQAGTRLGVRGTPAMLVNERFISGAPPGVLEDLVERAVRGAAIE
jgi:protein-disulfide isomerase